MVGRTGREGEIARPATSTERWISASVPVCNVPVGGHDVETESSRRQSRCTRFGVVDELEDVRCVDTGVAFESVID